MATEDEDKKPVDRGDEVTDPNAKKDDEQSPVTDDEKKVAGKADDKTDDKTDDKGTMLPKRRYDAVARQRDEERARREEAERKLADLERKARGEDKPPTELTSDELDAKLTELDRQVVQAQADGDVDKVVALMKQARKLETDFMLAQVENASTKATTTARSQTKLDQRVDYYESTFEKLNPTHDAYDEDLVSEINELREALELKGWAPDTALDRAVQLLMPELPAPTAGDKPPAKKTDVSKNLDAADRTPPDASDHGDPSGKRGMTDDIDVTKLSEEEFKNLPDSVKRRLRGDTVAA